MKRHAFGDFMAHVIYNDGLIRQHIVEVGTHFVISGGPKQSTLNIILQGKCNMYQGSRLRAPVLAGLLIMVEFQDTP